MYAAFRSPRLVRLFACSLVALSGGIVAARADTKIVSQSSTSGLPAAAQEVLGSDAKGSISEKTTTYFKGDMVRVEAPNSITLIRPALPGDTPPTATTTTTKTTADTAPVTTPNTGTTAVATPARVTYVLDPTSRTYYIAPAGGAAAGLAANSLMSSLSVDGDLTVTPTNATKTIAGRTVRQYRFNGTFKVSMGGAGGAPGFPLANTTVTGERWTAEDLTVASGATSDIAGSLLKAMPLMGKGMDRLASKFASIKGYPLLDVVSMKFTIPADSPMASVAAGALPTQPIVKRSEVTLVSESPLPDTLFEIPIEYKKVDPPIAPVLPGAF